MSPIGFGFIRGDQVAQDRQPPRITVPTDDFLVAARDDDRVGKDEAAYRNPLIGWQQWSLVIPADQIHVIEVPLAVEQVDSRVLLAIGINDHHAGLATHNQTEIQLPAPLNALHQRRQDIALRDGDGKRQPRRRFRAAGQCVSFEFPVSPAGVSVHIDDRHQLAIAARCSHRGNARWRERLQFELFKAEARVPTSNGHPSARRREIGMKRKPGRVACPIDDRFAVAGDFESGFPDDEHQFARDTDRNDCARPLRFRPFKVEIHTAGLRIVLIDRHERLRVHERKSDEQTLILLIATFNPGHLHGELVVIGNIDRDHESVGIDITPAAQRRPVAIPCSTAHVARRIDEGQHVERLANCQRGMVWSLWRWQRRAELDVSELEVANRSQVEPPSVGKRPVTGY